MKEAEWENAYKEDIGPCNINKGGICAKKEESISIIKGRVKEDM